jgi:hypothetical protein
MNEHPAGERVSLRTALDGAARELQTRLPPPGLQSRIQAAVRAQAQSTAARGAPVPAVSQAPVHGRRWAWGGAAACALVLVASVLLLLRVPPAAPGQAQELAGGFVPLVPPERWPREAAAAWLVQGELSGERLAALGLPMDPARAGRSVRAEMLVHPDGELLAVRFVP